MPVKSSGNRGPPEGRCQASRGVVHGPAFGLAFGFKDVKRDLPATAKIERPGVYVLQVGSYRNESDADRVREQLSKEGVHFISPPQWALPKRR